MLEGNEIVSTVSNSVPYVPNYPYPVVTICDTSNTNGEIIGQCYVTNV